MFHDDYAIEDKNVFPHHATVRPEVTSKCNNRKFTTRKGVVVFIFASRDRTRSHMISLVTIMPLNMAHVVELQSHCRI